MGRKIPAKKHRGIKDPLVQQARRFQSVKDKINAPPQDPDEQPVPRSLTRLFQQSERPPRPASPKRLPHTAGGEGGVGGEDGRRGAVARLRRLPGEAGRAFGLRISGAVRALHRPARGYPEEDSDAEGSETDARGMRMAWQRQRRARRTARRAAAAAAAAPLDAPAHAPAPALTRKQRRRLRLKDKKADKESSSSSRRAGEPVYERVRFGDVAPAPPALRPPRRAPPSRKAGARGLALSAALAPDGGAALRRERARLQAVAAYRALKRPARPARPRPPT